MPFVVGLVCGHLKQNLGEWIPWLVSVVNGAQNVDFQVTKRGGTIRGQADY